MLLRHLTFAAALLLAACQGGQESAEMDTMKSIKDFLPTQRLVALGPVPEVTTLDGDVRYIVLTAGDGGDGAPARMQDDVIISYDVYSVATGDRLSSTYGDDWPEQYTAADLPGGWRDAVLQMELGDEFAVFLNSPEEGDVLGNFYLGEPGEALVLRVLMHNIIRSGELELSDLPEMDMLSAFDGFLDEDRLAALGESPDIVETETGLRYLVVEAADPSGVSPQPYDNVTVHYDGRLASNGSKFDSSYDRGAPATFPAGRLIPGWVEALGLMKPGDEWVLFIPSDLGYGARGAGADIPPDSDLVFRVELQDVIPGTPPPPPREVDSAAWDRLTPWPESAADVVTTSSGLQYVVLASGPDGGVSPAPRDQVVVFYEGRLDDGTVFDSAFQRGAPAIFPAGALIPGWVEALALMKPGDRWMLHVPYDLAYGAAGVPPDIPPSSDLTFEVELMDVLQAG